MARFGISTLPWLAALACVLSCELAPPREGLLLPVGRLVRQGNSIETRIDGTPYKAQLLPDNSGGFWIKLPFSALKDKQGVQVLLSLESLATQVHEERINVARWTSPSELVDSDNPEIVAKARELTAGMSKHDQKARAILMFLQSLASEPAFGMHYKRASQTLADDSGNSVNHARLFVALCRASGIGARTVSGTLSGLGRDGHHEWAEYLDRRNNWCPVDPTIEFDLSVGPREPRHIDLVYDIESNPVYPFDKGWDQDEVALRDGDRSVFCADWGLQDESGAMSYRRLDAGGGDAIQLEVDYDLAKYRR